MDIKIVNAHVITATDAFKGEIGIRKGKIVEIAKRIPGKADTVIDAKGKYVFPGAIDIHTHLDMPFMGETSSDDFETGTIAAAFGGTTAIVDFAIQGKGMRLRDAFETWMNKAKDKAVIDYGFHVAICDLNDDVLAEIPEMVKEGITSFKCFLAYKGALMIDDGALFRILQKAHASGALVMIHAENGDIIDILVSDMIKNGKTEPKYHALSRPAEAEGEATGRGIAVAQMAGAPIYIVHLTCREALEKVKAARDAGFPAYAETCPQYLLLSYKNYEEPDFNGAKYVMSPPLRTRDDQTALWKALQMGDLQVVSTDHCPFNFKGQKELGRDDFSKIPNGAPGIENRVSLMFSEGVVKKRISLHRFVEIVSTAPAKLFGMFPNKGTIAVGSDADIVIFDPKKPFTISVKTNHQNVDYTPYEGWKGRGVVETVISGGRIVIADGKCVANPGSGRYIKRKPFKGSHL